MSDDPDAAERFKQLTVARDVLTDDTERARYDRLGHETYVRRHVRGRSGDEDTETSDGSDIAQQYVGQRATATGHTGASAATGRQPHQTRGEKSSYGTAADYYKPGERVQPAQPTVVETLLEAVRQVGPRLFAHLALFVCSVAFAVVLVAGGLAGEISPVVASVMAASMVTISLVVSATHVISRAST